MNVWGLPARGRIAGAQSVLWLAGLEIWRGRCAVNLWGQLQPSTGMGDGWTGRD